MSPAELLTREFDELRSRREIEEKLVRLWIAVCSGVLIGAFTFAQWADSRAMVALFATLAAGLLVGLAVRIGDKIDAEHQVYAGIGRTIVALLSLEYSLGDDASQKRNIGRDIADIGQGGGHAKTSELVRFSGGFTALALVVLGIGILALPSAREEPKSSAPTPAAATTPAAQVLAPAAVVAHQ